MWTGASYPAYADAVSETRLLVVPRATIRRMIARDPDLAMRMLGGLSDKLREFACRYVPCVGSRRKCGKRAGASGVRKLFDEFPELCLKAFAAFL